MPDALSVSPRKLDVPTPSRGVVALAGQMLGALLGWPQGAFASKLVVADGKLQVERLIKAPFQN